MLAQRKTVKGTFSVKYRLMGLGYKANKVSILTHVVFRFTAISLKQKIILFDSPFRSCLHSVYLHQRKIELFPCVSSSNQRGFKSSQRNL